MRPKEFRQHGPGAVDASVLCRNVSIIRSIPQKSFTDNGNCRKKAPAPVAGENIRALGTALAPRRTVGNMLAKNAANQK